LNALEQLGARFSIHSVLANLQGLGGNISFPRVHKQVDVSKIKYKHTESGTQSIHFHQHISKKKHQVVAARGCDQLFVAETCFSRHVKRYRCRKKQRKQERKEGMKEGRKGKKNAPWRANLSFPTTLRN